MRKKCIYSKPTLLGCLRWWWRCHTRMATTFGDFFVLPPEAKNIRMIIKYPGDTYDPYDNFATVGVKWDNFDHDKTI